MAMLAKLEQYESHSNGRRFARRKLNLRVPAAIPVQDAAVVRIHDLSVDGLLLETSASLNIGSTIEIELPEAGLRTAKVLWSDGPLRGCRFDDPISQGAISAAMLLNPRIDHPARAIALVVEQQDHLEKFPLRIRTLIFVGSGVFGWAMILGAIALAYRLL
jgi:hypothetical protein